MAKDIYDTFRDIGIIPVVAIEDASKAADLAHALVKGGLPASEVTFRTACAAEAIEAMIKAEPDMLVGAGTVLNVEQAEKAVKAGAKFIVAPSFNEGVAKLANRYQIPYIPGTQTIKEIVTAMEFGSDVIKVFPGDILGPRFVKDVKGPIPYASLMPSGGVDIDNIKDWVKAGVVAVSAGSSLTAGAKKGDFDLVTETAKKFIAEYKAAKASK